MSLIYKITNNINGKIYIGKTDRTLQERIKHHKEDSKREVRPLYNATNKYGWENFSFEIVEDDLTPEEATEREVYWIDKLRSYAGFPDSNGYNATLGGEGKLKYDYKEIADKYLELKTVKATAEFFNCDRYTVQTACNKYNIKTNIVHNKQKISQYDLNNNFIESFECVMDAGRKLRPETPDSARKNISRALNKKSTAYGFIWKYD